MIRLAVAITLGAAASAAHGQDIQAVLPDSTATRLVAFYNHRNTTRFNGDAHIAAGTLVRGDVAVLSGNLALDGTVEGNVVVINGDITLGTAGRITGYAHVAGGTVRAFEPTAIGQGAVVYREPMRYRHDDEGLTFVAAEMEPGVAAGRRFTFGRVDLLIAAHGAYNRVEGLPIAIGPRIRSSGMYPTSARALLIARTANADAIDPKRFGYEVRAEQMVSPGIGLTVGARLFAEMAAIEALGLSDREAALATFVLHRDYRDHYEREGWSAYAQLATPGRPYELSLEYRDEEHVATAPADPLTLLRTRERWPPQPSVAEGALRSIVAAAHYDTRNDVRDPAAGWFIQAQLERGLGGGIENPGLPDATAGDQPRPARSGFLSTTIDVRRYARLSPYARLAVRVVAAGSLDARALPPQRQHALGGPGSLPGYSAFAFDCGARRTTTQVRDQAFHPYYGCDRVTLVQLEYQASFPLARRLAESAGLSSRIGQLVRWVAFFDAGRAWNEPGAADGRLGGNDEFSADAGIGIRLGPLGGYWAVPLGRGGTVRFVARLDPRL